MVQDELLGFRDGQTLFAEGGVGFEAKGGSKGSGMVLGILSGRVVAVMVLSDSLDLEMWLLSLRGELSRRRRLRGEAWLITGDSAIAQLSNSLLFLSL